MKLIHDSVAVLKTGKFWKELFIMTAGMMVAAAAVYYFLMPGSLVIGNVSGLSIVISSLLAKVGVHLSVANTILVLNILLLILAFALLGNEFGAKTVYTALVLGPMTNLWALILPYEKIIEPGFTTVMGDPWLDLLGFVLLLGASQALMFSINASTGGLDILAKIMSKYMHMDIGAAVGAAGIITCFTAFAINPFRIVVLGIIGTWINGIIVDYFSASLSRKKRVCIISDHTEELRDYIINTIVRGCSIYEITGGYTGDKKQEIQVLLTNEEFSKVMKFIKDNDIQAFITAGNVSEIYGYWIKHQRHRRFL